MTKIIFRDTANIIVVNGRNEAILQKKDLGYRWAPGAWTLFGGGLESSENPLEAIRREFTEETTCQLNNLILIREHPYEDVLSDQIRRGKMYTYLATFDGKLRDLRICEGAGFAFFDERELGDIKVKKEDLEILRFYYGSFKKNHHAEV